MGEKWKLLEPARPSRRDTESEKLCYHSAGVLRSTFCTIYSFLFSVPGNLQRRLEGLEITVPGKGRVFKLLGRSPSVARGRPWVLGRAPKPSCCQLIPSARHSQSGAPETPEPCGLTPYLLGLNRA